MQRTEGQWWKQACATSKRLAQETISLRPIEAGDIGFLNMLYASTRFEELAATGWPDAERDRFLAMQFDMQHRYYQQHYPEADFLLVCRDKRPIGRVYWLEQGDIAALIEMSLLPAERGHGLGTALLGLLVARADQSGRAIRLSVEPDNPAKRLYRRFDFEPVDSNGVYVRMHRPARSRAPQPEESTS